MSFFLSATSTTGRRITIRCYDPRQLRRELSGLGVPSPWWGKANCFQNPLGCKPGTGGLLVTRDDLIALGIKIVVSDATVFSDADDSRAVRVIQQDDFLDLTIAGLTDQFNPELRPIKVVITGSSECITPGGPSDPDSVYLLPIADKRFMYYQRGDNIAKGYNVRSSNTGEYCQGTLNGGTAWTWEEMFGDIWPDALDQPSLPFTPEGTPENFWYKGISRFEAIEHILIRLACALKFDPFTNIFSVVRLGEGPGTDDTAEAANAQGQFWDRAGYLIHNESPLPTRASLFPREIHTEFAVKIPYSDGSVPYYLESTDVYASTNAGNTGASDPDVFAADTVIVLEDDLTAQCDGDTISNVADLVTRATERTNDFARKRLYYDTDKLLIYTGAINFVDSVGSYIYSCTWHDTGGSSQKMDGIKTELRAGKIYGDEFDLIAWNRCPSTYDGMQFDGDDTGEVCQRVLTDVNCVNNMMVKEYKFLTGHFTVSDTPCSGLEGGPPLGGPPLGDQPPTNQKTHWCWDYTTETWVELPIEVDCSVPEPPKMNIQFSGYGGGSRGFGLAGPSLGGGVALGGEVKVDPFPTGTSGQYLTFDSSGNLAATTLTAVTYLGDVTPAALVADANDYAPGAADTIRVEASGAHRSITGLSISPATGQRVVIENIGAVYNITLVAGSGSSSAANQFVMSSPGADVTLTPGNLAVFIYSNSRWRHLP